MRTSGIAIAVSMAIVGLSFADHASAVIRKTTSIPEQPLNSALRSLAKDRQFHVLFRSELVRNVRTAGAVGDLTTDEALGQLLGGTVLTYRYLDEQTVTIVPLSPDELASVTDVESVEAPAFVASAPVQSGPLVDVPSRKTGKATEDALEEITVTGSHIRGAEGVGAPVTVISRQDIDRTGYTTVHDILKTFTGTAGVAPTDEPQGGLEQQSNFGGGSSIGLRGLGASGTLVLVNGRRQAGGGLEGRFTDVSSIPATAVERIEIVADGASAVYGSDAVGGVVNVILRSDFDGAETRLRYGTAADGADETVIGQLVGRSWGRGHAMLSYQHWRRGALAFADREFSASTDKRSLGGDDFSLFFTNPGNIANPGTGVPSFAIPRGQDGTLLVAGDLLAGVVNTGNLFQGADLIPTQKMNSVVASASYRIGDSLDLRADARLSQRKMMRQSSAAIDVLNVPASNPFFVDPFGGSESVLVYYSYIDDFGPQSFNSDTTTYAGTLGGTLELAAGWKLDLDSSIGNEKLEYTGRNLVNPTGMATALADANPATAFNPFGDGSYTNPATLDAIRMTEIEVGDSDIWSTTAIIQGPLFHTRGGQVKAAIGGDYRSEAFDRLSVFTSDSGNLVRDPAQVRRYITAAFMELQVPVVGPANRLRGIESLSLSLAGRFEEYSDFGSTFNPKAGLVWALAPSLDVRASVGTSFKAPNLTDLDESSTVRPSRASLTVVPDPMAESGQSRILVISGNNDELREETATTWTVGVDLHPVAVPALNVSLTYFSIDFENRIQRGGPASIFDVFRAEQQWGPIITRNPSAAFLRELCSGAGPSISPAQCLASPIAAVVDTRVRNLGIVEVEGVDARFEYAIATALGTWTIRVDGSYLFTFDQATTRTSDAVDLVDTLGGPPSLRLRSGLSWAFRGWAADATVQHQNSYADQLSRPRRTIEAMTTLDLRLAYDVATPDAWINGTQIALSVSNVLDQEPPFVNNFYGYDPTNADPLGRVVSLQLTKQW